MLNTLTQGVLAAKTQVIHRLRFPPVAFLQLSDACCVIMRR